MDASEEMRREYKRRLMLTYWRYVEFKKLFLAAQYTKRHERQERQRLEAEMAEARAKIDELTGASLRYVQKDSAL